MAGLLLPRLVGATPPVTATALITDLRRAAARAEVVASRVSGMTVVR